MKNIMKTLCLFGLVSMILTGCQSTSNVLVEDASPFTRYEIYSYLSGNTQIRGESGIYYSEQGTLETIVEGERVEGSWSSSDGGILCRHIENMEDSCETYYHNGENISIVSGDATELAPKLMEGNAVIVKTLFTTEETIALVSGKTVVWGKSQGAYYDPDGTLKTIWDGVRESGKWEVNDKGGVCWKVPSWGNSPCEYYYMGAEGLTAVYQDKDSPASEHQEGNTIGSF